MECLIYNNVNSRKLRDSMFYFTFTFAFQGCKYIRKIFAIQFVFSKVQTTQRASDFYAWGTEKGQ